jgi:hypothetical protein
LIIGGAIVLGTTLVLALPEIVIARIRRSHIDANVPRVSAFDATLARDLGLWFTQPQGSPAEVRFELLCRRPTQTG